MLLLALLACPGPVSPADTPGHDSRDTGDSADTDFPDLPRDTGVLALSEASVIQGEAGDGLDEALSLEGGIWVSATRRDEGRGAVCRLEDEVLDSCFVGRHDQAFAGSALASVDGRLAIGSFWDGSEDEGAAFLTEGAGGSLSQAERYVGTTGSFAGIALSAGDLDDDGTTELIVGAFAADTSAYDGGAVWIAEAGEPGNLELSPGAYGTQDQGYLGVDLDLDDVDGDGVVDLLAGAFGEENFAGAAYLFLGPVDGITSAEDADATLTGVEDWAQSGKQVALGDLDGDGHADLGVGAPDGATVYVVMGPGWSGPLAEADARIVGEEGGRLGFSLSFTDLEGDGRADLLVGATRVEESAGAAYVFYGPVSGELSVDEADWTLTGEAAGDKAGSFVEAFEGQLFVAAPGADEGAGRIYLP